VENAALSTCRLFQHGETVQRKWWCCEHETHTNLYRGWFFYSRQVYMGQSWSQCGLVGTG